MASPSTMAPSDSVSNVASSLMSGDRLDFCHARPLPYEARNTDSFPASPNTVSPYVKLCLPPFSDTTATLSISKPLRSDEMLGLFVPNNGYRHLLPPGFVATLIRLTDYNFELVLNNPEKVEISIPTSAEIGTFVPQKCPTPPLALESGSSPSTPEPTPLMVPEPTVPVEWFDASDRTPDTLREEAGYQTPLAAPSFRPVANITEESSKTHIIVRACQAGDLPPEAFSTPPRQNTNHDNLMVPPVNSGPISLPMAKKKPN